ncbi:MULTISPECIES: CGNR zinc finger domain-containing protein [unclassified Streptomyces]|uniref:CGNR zinc finger domain-containing protein n=1 Tax=unclassified Streptomyces TaxID=2593676 RepID=UPI0033B212B7
MHYVDYLGNVTRFAVELVNTGHADELTADSTEMLTQHGIVRPGREEIAPVVALIREALQQIVDEAQPGAVEAMLDQFPPEMRLSDHDGAGVPHIHFARDHSAPAQWIGRTVAATLAHLAAQDPGLTLGRCAAESCQRFFVDQSRNRTRRFCGNACASRTTVAAHRARVAGREAAAQSE